MTRNRIRVLHVITRLVIGGAQENTLLTVGRLDRERYEVTLASGPTTGPEGSLEDRLPAMSAFERIPGLVRRPHPVQDAAALARLYALMRRDRYQIVHTHTTKAGILGRMAARLARVPVVLHTPHGHAFHDYLDRTGSAALRRLERWLARLTDQRTQMRADPAHVLVDQLLDRPGQLRLHLVVAVGLEDPGLRLDHLRQRPEGDAFSVWQ